MYHGSHRTPERRVRPTWLVLTLAALFALSVALPAAAAPGPKNPTCTNYVPGDWDTYIFSSEPVVNGTPCNDYIKGTAWHWWKGSKHASTRLLRPTRIRALGPFSG